MIQNFTWYVYTKGYVWKKCPDELGRQFYACVPQTDWPWKHYHPLSDEPALFKILASTKKDRASIMDFASRYGSLGLDFDLGRVQSEPLEPDENVSKVKTSLTAALIDTDSAVRRLHNADFEHRWVETIDQLGRIVPVLDRIPSASVTSAEVTELMQVCNQAWREHSMAVELAESLEKGSFEFVFRPRNLYGAVWFQLATALVGKKEYGTCPACAKIFEISKDRGRLNQKYCGDACKSRAYRKRKEEAVALFENGMSDKDIAEKLNGDLKTVRKWIKKK